jgi:hypothetical protein
MYTVGKEPGAGWKTSAEGFATLLVPAATTLESGLTDEARLEVLDPASLPEAPVWPPRGQIITGGLLAGLLLGLAAVHIFARERAAGGATLGHQDLVDAADAFLEAERGSGQP